MSCCFRLVLPVQAQRPSLDVQFALFQRRKQLDDAMANSEAVMAMSRVRIEDMRRECDMFLLFAKEQQVRLLSRNTGQHGFARHVDERVLQNEFWLEMLKPDPSLALLARYGEAIIRASKTIDASFQRQLKLSPNSVQIMRRYARFLAEVCVVSTEDRGCRCTSFWLY